MTHLLLVFGRKSVWICLRFAKQWRMKTTSYEDDAKILLTKVLNLQKHLSNQLYNISNKKKPIRCKTHMV